MIRLILVGISLGLVLSTQAYRIDKESKLKDFAEKSWYLENIPFIEIPDKSIEDVYYYRWSSHKRHLRYVAPGSGYMVTEFVQDPGWHNKLGFLNDAAGHHIYESRWLKDDKYNKDYINMWTRMMDKIANHHYSEWIADAAYNAYLISGDKEFLVSQLEGLLQIYNDWNDHYIPQVGLYHISPLWDAQEFSASSVQTDDTFAGGIGYRPSFNSEMFANAKAIAKIARLAGENDLGDRFDLLAKDLKESIIKYLWDDERQFFYHMQRDNNPKLELLDTREEVGLYPWRYGVIDDRRNFSVAFDQLLEKGGFDTEFGPSTCETRSKWYDGEQKNPKCCWWNGNSWPYSTAHVLKSIATHIREYSQQNPKIDVSTYMSVLQKYAKTQYKNNKPYVAECHSPGHDFWVCDSGNHSEHYAHSTYTDNVLHELLGILPQEDDTLVIDPLIPNTWTYFMVENLYYRTNKIKIVYDKTGDKYNEGKGLFVYVEDDLKGKRDTLGKLKVDVPPAKPKPKPEIRLENYAANPFYSFGFPRSYASFSDYAPGVPFQAFDGRIFYDTIPSNRWSNVGSPNADDWLAIDFGRQKTFDSVTLYIYSDVVTNKGKVDCPSKISVQYLDGAEWKDVKDAKATPQKCAPNDVNKITFTPVKTSQLRAVFTRNTEKDYFVGVTEMEVWAPFPQTASNTYEAEDGLIYNAVMFNSESASGGAYVGKIDRGDSIVELNGVYVDKAGDYKVRVYYTNPAEPSSHRLLVNNVRTAIVSYKKTQTGWGQFNSQNFVEITVPLLRGNNVVQFIFRDKAAELDKVEIIV